MSRILFIVESSPYTESANSDEAHDLIMASTAYGHKASVLFSSKGVTQLLKAQNVPCGYKDTAKRIRGFEMFDVEPLYVCEQSLQNEAVSKDRLIDEVIALSPETIAGLKADSSLIIRL